MHCSLPELQGGYWLYTLLRKYKALHPCKLPKQLFVPSNTETALPSPSLFSDDHQKEPLPSSFLSSCSSGEIGRLIVPPEPICLWQHRRTQRKSNPCRRQPPKAARSHAQAIPIKRRRRRDG